MGKKPPEAHQKEKQTAVRMATADGNLSQTAMASFMEGLQDNSEAPRHSTALEEDLLVDSEQKKVGKKSTEPAASPQGWDDEEEPKAAPRKREKPTPAPDVKRKATATSSRAVRASAAKRNEKRSRMSLSESASGGSSEAHEVHEAHEKSKGEGSSQSRREDLTSDEELEDDWKPSPKKKKMKVKNFGPTRSRTSSPEKSRKPSSEEDLPNTQRRKKKNNGPATGMEVVLEEFKTFFKQYKETVESTAVKKVLDSFASNMEEQFQEKISSDRRWKALVRENSKVAAAVQKKRQRLLDAKNELIKSERQVLLQQKDKSELEQRLSDLNQSRTFLQNIRELNGRYLRHRREHPDAEETYGASSLPALLIEAKHVQAAISGDCLQEAVGGKQ